MCVCVCELGLPAWGVEALGLDWPSHVIFRISLRNSVEDM